LNHV